MNEGGEGETSFWQGYADLAMGLMAVFLLLLVLLLVQEKADNAKMMEERREFAEQMLVVLAESRAIVDRQRQAEGLIGRVFDTEGCRLTLGDADTLQFVTGDGDVVGELFEKNAYLLSGAARDALVSCAEQFELLAVCLMRIGPTSHGGKSGRSYCAETLGVDVEVVDALATGLDAIVLQGNTDSSMNEKRGKSYGRFGVKNTNPLARSFVENSLLGARRAREALGTFVFATNDEYSEYFPQAQALSPQDVLMSRLRVESASFSRYQVGPKEWRVGDCLDAKFSSRGGKDPRFGEYCDEARNLRMEIRWKSESLREPYQEVQGKICEQLQQKEGALYRGFIGLPKEEQARFRNLCEN